MATGRFFPLQTLDLSPTGSVSDFNVATLPIGAQLGQIFEQDGKCYRLVKFSNGTGNVACVVGGAAYWEDKSAWLVTSDITDQEASANSGAGGFVDVLTDGYYGLIQIGGDQTGVKVDAGTGIGEQLTAAGSTDMELVSVAVGTAAANLPVAIALTAADAGTATVRWILGNLI